MARFRLIDRDKAPRPAKQSGRLAARMQEFDSFVEQVAASNGKVGELMPEDSDTARGLALRISRAAKRMGKSANTWGPKEGPVYFTIN